MIGHQAGMAVCMPTPLNQPFNDESIAEQIIFLDVYTWNYPWIRWNTGLIGDGSEFQGYFVIYIFFSRAMCWRLFIKCLLCTYIYVALTVFRLIIDIVNNSAGLITSYHKLDAIVRGMFTPPDEVSATNRNTNTISSVMCISDALR